jgi:predicted O-methyltransferase YrrM/glycosyltransferase involved in cell wall biosynthesis
VDGWLNVAEGRLLFRLARKCSGQGVIVEIGSWKGKSTIWLGHGSHAGRKVRIHAVDPHTGSPEHGGKSRHVWTFEEFQQNIKAAGVDDVIVAHVDHSVTAAQKFTEPIELIFVDGLHEYESVKADFEAWFPKVIEGGIMAFHDTTGWAGPRKVVTEQLFKSRHFKKVRFVRSITYGEKTAHNTALERIGNRVRLLVFLTYAFIYRWLWRMKSHLMSSLPALRAVKKVPTPTSNIQRSPKHQAPKAEGAPGTCTLHASLEPEMGARIPKRFPPKAQPWPGGHNPFGSEDACQTQPGTARDLELPAPTPRVSIGILAWNEEEAIEAMLRSLFEQSLFAELERRNLICEVLCVANGCTDHTAEAAAKVFVAQRSNHPSREAFSCQVVNIRERGKSNAWNQYVHSHSARAARFLFLMDGDIVLQHPDTLWNMYAALCAHPEASIAVDQPIKDVALKPDKTLRDRLSLATSRMTQTGSAQLTGQLYCIRAEVARKIYLPRDLLVEDGFIKAVVCTDFLTRPSSPERIVRAAQASHVFQAYRSARDILKNQNRQMMAQTITHLLVDRYLNNLPSAVKADLAQFVEEKDRTDPLWLKRLIGDHVRRTRHFWRLFPGILNFRFQRLGQLRGVDRLRHLPAATVGFCVTLISCWAARRALRAGYIDYWPKRQAASALKIWRPAI